MCAREACGLERPAMLGLCGGRAGEARKGGGVARELVLRLHCTVS